MFSLEGRTALVTGASGGIGGAIAGALVAAGAKTVITGTREAVLAEKAAELGDLADRSFFSLVVSYIAE